MASIRDVLDVKIGGRTLTGMGIGLASGGATVGATTPATSEQTPPGRDGTLDLTLVDARSAAYTGRRTIEINVYAAGTETEVITAKTTVAALHGTVTTITWRGLPGSWHGRVSVGEWSDVIASGRLAASTATISMDAMPCLYGQTVRATLASGANSLRVTGNRPTWPCITLNPTSGSKTASVSDGRGHKIEITATGQQLTGAITIETDPDGRSCRIAGNLTAPTLDSDYFPLLPGTMGLTLSGCTGSVSYEPLTLI